MPTIILERALTKAFAVAMAMLDLGPPPLRFSRVPLLASPHQPWDQEAPAPDVWGVCCPVGDWVKIS